MHPRSPSADGLWSPDRADILDLLARATMTALRPVPRGSNATFLVHLEADGEGRGWAIYKPRRGEAPLWDFPEGTLYRREYAAYLLSRLLGWPDIPPTVIRDGPYGIGSLQLYVDAIPDAHYFTFRSDRAAEARRIAAFDVIANNADRKAGHCLLGRDGRIWCIDHGITFNAMPKLRTVIWDFAGEPLPEDILAGLRRLAVQLQQDSPLVQELKGLLAPAEWDAFRRRVDGLIQAGRFPDPPPYRHIPWPMI